MTHAQRTQRGWHSRRRWLMGSVLLLGAGLASAALGQAGAQVALAPFVNHAGKSAIPDHYIVVLKRGASASAMASAQGAARNAGGRIRFTYTSALRGFSVAASPAGRDRLRALPEVSYVEADSVVTASTVQFDPPPPTGLDRTSERLLPLDNRFTYSHDGTGVHVYVIDSGIHTTHDEFEGRASGAFDAVEDGGGTDDCAGHGTHVAGTIGGITYGIAKNVTLHAVRVLDCHGRGTVAGALAGVDWVTANAVAPAVANMSLVAPLSPTLNTAVTESIATGVLYTIAAANGGDDLVGDDACDVSPASTPDAITVGNIDPTNDTRAVSSNWGPCLDLFAPGEDILSAWSTNNGATAVASGTSMAAPHVAGVAALYLQDHRAASPADVRDAILAAADVNPGTVGWPGIVDPGDGSPDVLLHWGSRNDGIDDGDPHLTTVDGIRYDFQSAGEFVMLRDGNGLEIQTRQTPVETHAVPGVNSYTGLASCPSINTAVAARVGTHRISLEPDPMPAEPHPQPDGPEPQPDLRLRVDGVLTTLGGDGFALGPGGRIARSPSGEITVDFPDGTTLIVTPKLWTRVGKWYLGISVFRSPGSEGVIGALAPGSWLPALPGGASLGPRPGGVHQRHVDLNTTFANAWRVTDATTLFDYAPGTSTATYTIPDWPPEQPPCVLPDSDDIPVDPLDLATAQSLCSQIADPNRRTNCIDDVRATGEPGFAQAHQLSEKIIDGSTSTWLDDAHSETPPGAEARFTATVIKNTAGPAALPAGTVQLVVDGKNTGTAVKLDGLGQAVWKLTTLAAGVHQIAARYAPTPGTVFLASASLTRSHTVR
jgi:subtilisin family serine protease